MYIYFIYNIYNIYMLVSGRMTIAGLTAQQQVEEITTYK